MCWGNGAHLHTLAHLFLMTSWEEAESHVTDVETDTRKDQVTPGDSYHLSGGKYSHLHHMYVSTDNRVFHGLAIPLLSTYPTEMHICTHLKMCRRISWQYDLKSPEMEIIQMPCNGRIDEVCGICK